MENHIKHIKPPELAGLATAPPPARARVRPRTGEAGFTLVEMVIVVMVSGLLLGLVFSILNQDGDIKSAKMNSTFDNVLMGIAEYKRIYGFYPCPADPALPATDAAYGEPNVNASGTCVAAAAGATAAGVNGGSVIIGTVPVRALNRAMGCVMTPDSDLPDNLRQVFQNKLNSARQIFFEDVSNFANYSDLDRDGTGAMNNLNFTNTSHRCVGDSLGQDLWGTKLTYAVTANATHLNQTPPPGNIRIINSNGQPATASPVHFVLVSHGPDQKGGRMHLSGAAVAPCGGGTSRDDENCNNDAIFRAMPLATSASAYDVNHFDDRVEFSLTGYEREKDVWRWAGNAGSGDRNVVLDTDSTKSLRIGIPGSTTVDDDAKLSVFGGNMEIEGNLRAQGINSAAQSAVTSRGDVHAGENVVVGTGTATGQAAAPKFCYEPPITAACAP